MAKSKSETKQAREFTALQRNVRISARKARLVMDLIKGQYVDEAELRLKYANKRAAAYIYKVLKSAVANATTTGSVGNPDNLYVADARADKASRGRNRRWRPVSRGSAHPYIRYTSHLTVTVREE
jgi:large subunit ribosomal protein L22